MSQGAFVWYDLATTDMDAASRFYADVVGWQLDPKPEMHYTLFTAGGAARAGLMTLPERLREAGVPPHWSGYIHVDDVDEMVSKAQAKGGTLTFGPEDIPGVGRFAALADPVGGHFYLFKPNAEDNPPAPMTLGTVGWNELIASDQQAAFDFYGSLFGWEKGRALEMGPMGTYQIYGWGGLDRGGMMSASNGMPPHWTFYFVVDGIDAAKDRLEKAGGAVTHGPMEVPGGAWIVGGTDPQGGHFALVSATK